MEKKEFEIILHRDNKVIEKQKQTKKPLKKINMYKTVFKLTGFVLAGSVVGTVATMVVNANTDFYKRKENLEPFSKIVSDNTHRTDDFQNFWYDTKGIVNDLEQYNGNDTVLDLAIYKVYTDIDYNRTKNMDDIVNSLGYKSFENYLKEKGYSSIDEYDKVMKQLASSDYAQLNINRQK